MTVLRFILHFSLVCVALLLARCSLNTAGSPGTGSETTNGIVANVVYPNGRPVSSADVYIRHSDFLTDTTLNDTSRTADAVTDTAGWFVLDSVMPGDYIIEVNDGRSNAALIECKKTGVSERPMDLGVHVMQPTSLVSGHIDRSNLKSGLSIYVQIYGMNKIARVDAVGLFSFHDVPAGRLELRIASSDQSLGVIDHDTIVVSAGNHHDLGNFQLPANFWKDTLVIRVILNLNGLDKVPVATVGFYKKGRIFQLDLRNLGLKKLPPLISLLRLSHLYLDSNALDSLPSLIGSIASLEYLSVSSNHLTSIPGALGNLKKLKHLDANGNAIDSLPSTIGQLVSLSDLQLKDNALSSIPESVGDLRNLQKLDLENNRLSSLPSTITKLRPVAFLSVLQNRLTSVPEAIATWLDLYSTEKGWMASQSQ
jgi:hypothetical protein